MTRRRHVHLYSMFDYVIRPLLTSEPRVVITHNAFWYSKIFDYRVLEGVDCISCLSFTLLDWYDPHHLTELVYYDEYAIIHSTFWHISPIHTDHLPFAYWYT